METTEPCDIVEHVHRMHHIKMDELKELAYVLKNAKVAEALARSGRIDAEEQIASLIPTEDIGQKTVTLSDGTKITVKRGLNYKANLEQIQDYYFDLPDKHSPVKMKTVKELDSKGYEWIKQNDPESFTYISNFVTVTPKKVAVTLVVK